VSGRSDENVPAPAGNRIPVVHSLSSRSFPGSRIATGRRNHSRVYELYREGLRKSRPLHCPRCSSEHVPVSGENMAARASERKEKVPCSAEEIKEEEIFCSYVNQISAPRLHLLMSAKALKRGMDRRTDARSVGRVGSAVCEYSMKHLRVLKYRFGGSANFRRFISCKN
jgi:hypothetical protein